VYLKLRYVHAETKEIRNVSIPMGGEIPRGTLRNIAEQCGADDFQEWCRWIDDHLWRPTSIHPDTNHST